VFWCLTMRDADVPICVGLCDTGTGLPCVKDTRDFLTDGEQGISRHGEVCARHILSYCPTVQFRVARVFDGRKRTDLASVMHGVNWLLSQPVEVILLSLGSYARCPPDGLSSLRAMARRRGVVIVCPQRMNDGRENSLARFIGTVMIEKHHRVPDRCYMAERQGEYITCTLPDVNAFQDDTGRRHHFHGYSSAAAAFAGALAALLQDKHRSMLCTADVEGLIFDNAYAVEAQARALLQAGNQPAKG